MIGKSLILTIAILTMIEVARLRSIADAEPVLAAITTPSPGCARQL